MTYRSSLVLVAGLLAVCCITPAPPPAVNEPGAAPEVVPVEVTKIPAPSGAAGSHQHDSGSAAPSSSGAAKPAASAPASVSTPASHSGSTPTSAPAPKPASPATAPAPTVKK